MKKEDAIITIDSLISRNNGDTLYYYKYENRCPPSVILEAILRGLQVKALDLYLWIEGRGNGHGHGSIKMDYLPNSEFGNGYGGGGCQWGQGGNNGCGVEDDKYSEDWVEERHHTSTVIHNGNIDLIQNYYEFMFFGDYYIA